MANVNSSVHNEVLWSNGFKYMLLLYQNQRSLIIMANNFSHVLKT